MPNLYGAFILPHFECPAPLFLGLNKGLSEKFESTNAFALRTLLTLPKTASYDELLKVATWGTAGSNSHWYSGTQQHLQQYPKLHKRKCSYKETAITTFCITTDYNLLYFPKKILRARYTLSLSRHQAVEQFA